jgi:hypothetical protein
MTPIPSSAMPVVEILRRDVKRPQFISDIGINPGVYVPSSPLKAVVCDLEYEEHTAVITLTSNKKAANAFVDWFDQADAAEAMDSIWPPELELRSHRRNLSEKAKDRD